MDPDKETAKWRASPVWTEVTVTGDRAEMSLAVFDKLDDYSCSLPSGVYIGKRWKRHEPYVGPGAWWMGEYAEDYSDPDQAKIIWREIYIHHDRRATDEIVKMIRNATAVEKALTA